MNQHNVARTIGACFLFASSSLPTLAHAQLAGEIAAPERVVTDENGVNVATGTYRAIRTDLVVGSGPGALSAEIVYSNLLYRDARTYVR